MVLQDRLFVALDTPSLTEALDIAQDLHGLVTHFKVGLELLCAEGAPKVLSAFRKKGVNLFFDGKFSDIPNTVAAATKAIADQGVYCLDVHANCGEASVRAAVTNRGSAQVYVVTVLTSITETECESLFGQSPLQKVTEFFNLALDCGAQGVVCSPKDLDFLKNHPRFHSIEKITPGVRPSWAEAQDQKRICTPREALSRGATRLVVGRPIVYPPKSIGSRRKAAERILEEMEDAQ